MIFPTLISIREWTSKSSNNTLVMKHMRAKIELKSKVKFSHIRYWVLDPDMNVTVLWPIPSYTAWWHRHIGVNNLPKVVMQLWPRGNWTHDLLIASPTLYRIATAPPNFQIELVDYCCSIYQCMRFIFIYIWQCKCRLESVCCFSW